MESCIGNYFIKNEEFISSCDFNITDLPEHKSVYDVFRFINQKPVFFKYHVLRFLNSIQSIDDTSKINKELISEIVKALIEYNKFDFGNIKLVYNINNSKSEFYAWLNPFNYPSGETKKNGVNCKTYFAERPDPKVKHSNTVLRNSIKKFILDENIFEAVLYDKFGFITEGSRSNLFFVKEDRILTSPQHKVLNGISRETVKKICRENNIPIFFTDINKDDIKKYDAAFLSGTSINVLPIKNIDGIDFDNKNPVLKFISDMFELKIKEDLSEFSWKL